MENPWNTIKLESNDFVHPKDKLFLQGNCLYPPQPYLGSYDNSALMWLLGGFGTGEGMAFENFQYHDYLLKIISKNLNCKVPDLPNFWLSNDCPNEQFSSTRDVRWWRNVVRMLNESLTSKTNTMDWVILSERVFILEAYPYPSKTRPSKLLPTHTYTKYLLDSWVDSGKPILMGRAERFWVELSPKFKSILNTPQVIKVKNDQSAYLTPNNLQGGQDAFDSIVDLLAYSQTKI